MKTIKSAREAIHLYYTHQMRRPESDAELLKVRIQYTAKGGGGCMWLGMELGDLVRPLNKLKPLPRAWAMYAYAGEPYYTMVQHSLLVDHTIKAAAKVYKLDTDRLGIPRRLSILATMALKDSAHNDVTGARLYGDKDYSKGVGIKPSEWLNDWHKLLAPMQNLHSKLAAQSLGPVYEKMEQVREQDAVREFGT